MTVPLAASSSVTVKSISSSSPSFPLPPAMLTVGITTARFRIVPVAVAVPRSAPEALESVTVNVSSLSFSESSLIDTDTVLLVVPALKLSVPLALV